MEGHSSTGQSPQWAVVSMEEEYLKISLPHRLSEQNFIQSVTGGKDQTSGGCSLC